MDFTPKKEQNKQWLEWNQQGFIPGPQETEEDFLERISYCLSLTHHLKEMVSTPLPFQSDSLTTSLSILEESLPQAESFYGIHPHWVPIFFSNYQLAPWHGGCAWIFQMNEKTPTAALLQLRNSLSKDTRLLKLVSRKELVTHELSHIGRMLYEEPEFEEYFAYASSSSSWRRWLGPIVQSSKESFAFVMLLGLVLMIDLAFLSLEHPMPLWTWGIKLLPVAMIGWGIGRLAYRHSVLKKCLNQLNKFLPEAGARHFLYRLRDHEIKNFSQLQPNEIQSWIENEAKNSFRWRFLSAIYRPSS